MATSFTFTCLSCHVAFASSENQREHYQSDWHRYNLKRKVTELPPINETQYNSISLETQNAALLQEHFTCPNCNAVYSSQKQFKLHEKKDNCSSSPTKQTAAPSSPTFIQKLSKAESEAEVMALIDEKIQASVKLTHQDCLFCHHQSPTFELNLKHMTASHSFFIPDIEYLIDLTGLFEHLAEKIAIDNICLYCNGAGKSFYTIDSVRAHMIDKGHCKVLYGEGAEDEFLNFYDFEEDSPDDDEWCDVTETISGGSHDDVHSLVNVIDVKEAEESDMDIVSEATTTGVTRRSDIMRKGVPNATGTTLILPSGRQIGHRAFNKYWTQKLKPDSMTEAMRINQLVGQYKSLGYYNGQAANRVEVWKKKLQSREQIRHREDVKSRVGMKANALQKHFRHQNPL